MLWHDLERVTVDERAQDDRQPRGRPGRFYFDRIVIHFGELFNRVVKGGAVSKAAGLGNHVSRKDHVIGGKRFSVIPSKPLPKLHPEFCVIGIECSGISVARSGICLPNAVLISHKSACAS